MSEQRHDKTEEANSAQKKTCDSNHDVATIVGLAASEEANHSSNDLTSNRGVHSASEASVHSSACQSAIENSTKTAAPPRWFEGENQLKITNSNVRSRTPSVGSASSDWPNSSNCQTAEERSTKTAISDSRSPSPFKWSQNSDMTGSIRTSTSNLSTGNYSSARSPSLRTAESDYSRFDSSFSLDSLTSAVENTESTQYSVSRNPSPMRKGLTPEDRSRSRNAKTTTSSMKKAAAYSHPARNHSPAKEGVIHSILDNAVHKSARGRSPSGSFQTLGFSRSSSAPPTEISIPRSPNALTEGTECETNNQVATLKTLPDGTVEVHVSVSVSAPVTRGRLHMSGMAPEGFKMNRIVVNDNEITTNN